MNETPAVQADNVSNSSGAPTPAPWQFVNGYIAGMGENNATIAKVTNIRAMEANARLIVAAPELLASLRKLRNWCDANLNGAPTDYAAIMEQCDAVLRKATNES